MRKYLLAIAVVFACISPVSATQVDYSNKDLDCMARTMYFEARGESERGMVMVGEVTLNRVKHGKYPSSVCGVVYQKGAFSWTKGNTNIRNQEAYKRAKRIAKEVLDGENRTGTEALFFKRASSVSAFHNTRKYLGREGNHEFYK